MKSSAPSLGRKLGACALSVAVSGLPALAAEAHVEMDPRATPVPYDSSAFQFGPDPVYTHGYDFQRQLDIYGAKHMNPTARPLLELGRELYGPGQFQPGINLFGKKNLVFPQLLLYGDMRTVAAFNDNGGTETAILAHKLTLDLDLKITATERIHATFTPLDRDGKTSRFATVNGANDNDLILDAEPDALFFEGDMARIIQGFTNKDNRYDAPFTVGLIPLLFQNGVWMQDAILGFAFTIPARNSPTLQISNMDITFFAGFDRVTSAALHNDHAADVYGFNIFLEAMEGYWEIGYGNVRGRGASEDLSYHNFSAAFTRRYWDRISNSVRVIANVGQDPVAGKAQTADGYLFLLENSLITHLPSTLVPYLNAWYGVDKPQSLARAAGAGGVLLNTGINFETDGITGFPKMDDTANNTYGAALGIEYLFNLDQQLVFEIAALDGHSARGAAAAKDPEFGFGARYQRNLNHAWIFRTDAVVISRDAAADLAGVRLEMRRKF